MKFKKITTAILATLMLIMLTGCNEGGSSKVITSTGDSDTLITKEPVELSVFFGASKEEDGQWKLFEEAAKLTNVNAKVTISKSNSDFNQAFNLMVASGNIPDIVMTYNPVQFSKLGAEGAFVHLNEYFDEFMPAYTKLLEETPEIRKRTTASDGNIYYIPFIPEGKASTGWFVRQDWLDKLGLKAPTNKEELYNVLTEFRTKDPNGNGKKDEVPYFSSDKLKPLFLLWNTREGWYVEDGNVKFGPVDHEYKTAINEIKKWYDEGLIDQEVLTRASSPRDKMLNDNLGGMTHDWFGSTARYNDSLKDKIPGINLVAIAPPEGKALSCRPVASSYGWGVSAGSKHIEIAVKFMDFWFTEKGDRLINFGLEGTHYDMVDGVPIFKPELIAQPDFQTKINDFGVQLGVGYKQDFDYEKQWLNQTAIDGIAMYEENNWFVEQMPPVGMMMSSDESERYAALKNQVDTYANEMLQKWILGAADINETYDEFKKEINKLGFEELMQLQQAAYDRYNQN